MTSHIDNSLASIIKDIGLGRPEAKKDRNSLGQEEFLKLMITQLENQDPFKPMENGEFISQMAQFSSVAGLKELQTSFSQLATSLQSNQALQASTMVGRSVLVPSEMATLGANQPLTGIVELPVSSNNVNVTITDSTGQIIRQINLGPHTAGDISFSWDGLSNTGTAMPAGTYKIAAEAKGVDGNFSVRTLVHAAVESVSLGSNQQGIKLNLRDLGSVAFSEVREIK